MKWQNKILIQILNKKPPISNTWLRKINNNNLAFNLFRKVKLLCFSHKKKINKIVNYNLCEQLSAYYSTYYCWFDFSLMDYNLICLIRRYIYLFKKYWKYWMLFEMPILWIKKTKNIVWVIYPHNIIIYYILFIFTLFY